jgi:D-alanyl-D-alanine carboxypeptidase (penicillin-binding protein 5/6)
LYHACQCTTLNIAPESVEAQAWSIIDAQSGQTIAEYNSNAQRAPASLTKMMVAYIALKEIKAGKLRKDEILTATPVVKWFSGMNPKCI